MRHKFHDSVDAVIVGAGINGLLVARELINEGASVRLIERGVCGQEASWAGGGIISPLYPWRYSDAVTALASWAQDFYPRLVDSLRAETGIDPELDAHGLLVLASEDRRRAIDWSERHGRRVEVLSASDIRARNPLLRVDELEGLWMPQVASVRNPRLLQALKASLSLSARFQLQERCSVEKIEEREGGAAVSFVSAGRVPGRISSRRVIVTAGAWSGELLQKSGIELPIEPVKGEMLLYRAERGTLDSIVLSNGRYLIPRRDGHILAGSTLEYAGFDKSINASSRASLQESAIGMLPQLASLQPIGQWAGLRPGAPSGVPFIGAAGSSGAVYLCAGQFRNGLVLAPASARLVYALAFGAEPNVAPEPYSLEARR
jgi:glycine oxidase